MFYFSNFKTFRHNSGTDGRSLHGCRRLHDWKGGRGIGAAPEGAAVPVFKHAGAGDGGRGDRNLRPAHHVLRPAHEVAAEHDILPQRDDKGARAFAIQLPSTFAVNAASLIPRLVQAGFSIGGKTHPIAPVLLGDAKLAGEFAQRLLDRGIFAVAFSYPVVPKGAARIRVQLSAAHTQEQLQHAVDSFVAVGKQLGVIE